MIMLYVPNRLSFSDTVDSPPLSHIGNQSCTAQVESSRLEDLTGYGGDPLCFALAFSFVFLPSIEKLLTVCHFYANRNL